MKNHIEMTKDYVESLLRTESSGHDWWHTVRVRDMALSLAQAEPMTINEEILLLAIYLHDVHDYKLSKDENAGPLAAATWLKSIEVEPWVIDEVVEIISTMSFKGQVHRPMRTIEGMIVQDADRLEAVGAIGIARAFAFGGAFGREIFNPQYPVTMDLSVEEYKHRTHPSSSVNHFYEKLLKLDGRYNRPMANEIGHQRHVFMKQYLEELLKEVNAEESEYSSILKQL